MANDTIKGAGDVYESDLRENIFNRKFSISHKSILTLLSFLVF